MTNRFWIIIYTQFKIFYCALVSCIFIIASCDTNKVPEDLGGGNYEKYLLETVNLPVDSMGTYEFYWIQYIEGEVDDILAVLNKTANSLDFYDLDEKKLNKRIMLGTDEKFGKFQANGFYYHNPDSIFIYPHFTLNGTLIINSQGEVVHKVKADIPEDYENPYALNHVSSPSSPSVFIDGKVHATIVSLTSSSWHSGLSEKFKTNITLDPLNGEICFVPNLSYPEEYIGKATTDHHSFLCRELVDDRFWVHSYPLLDSVFLYKKDYTYLGAKYAGSTFFDGFIELRPGTSHKEQYKHVIQKSSYARIIYDKYKKLFYRVVLIGRKLDPSRDIDSRDNSRNRFSVVIFNNDFQKIKEVVFPPEIYFHYAAFVGKNGFYLPKINKDYVGLSEDLISYDIFDFNED